MQNNTDTCDLNCVYWRLLFGFFFGTFFFFNDDSWHVKAVLSVQQGVEKQVVSKKVIWVISVCGAGARYLCWSYPTLSLPGSSTPTRFERLFVVVPVPRLASQGCKSNKIMDGKKGQCNETNHLIHSTRLIAQLQPVTVQASRASCLLPVAEQPILCAAKAETPSRPSHPPPAML